MKVSIKSRSLIGIVPLCLLSLLLLSDTTFASQECGKECVESLRTRADEFLNLRVKGEMEKAFKYESPESVKDVTLTDYVQSVGGGVRWLSAKADQINLKKDNIASILVRIRYKWTFTPDVPEKGFEGTYYDHWKRIDGTWYHIYHKPSYEKILVGGKKQKGETTQTPEENAGDNGSAKESKGEAGGSKSAN